MIFIIIASGIILIISLLLAKKLIIKSLQDKYEKSLLNGDRKRADHLGKIYYHSLDEVTRKAKGIINIEEKISDDFRSFNSKGLSILF